MPDKFTKPPFGGNGRVVVGSAKDATKKRGFDPEASHEPAWRGNAAKIARGVKAMRIPGRTGNR